MEHPLVADADGPRLAGINAGNDEDFVFHLVLYLDQAMDVIENSLFIIGRTRTDDEQESIILPGKDISDDLITPPFNSL